MNQNYIGENSCDTLSWQSNHRPRISIVMANQGIGRSILLIVIALGFTQELKGSPNFIRQSEQPRVEFETINKNLEHLYITENVNALIGLYAESFTFFPEYKTAILDIDTLRKFFTSWFTAADFKKYKKTIYAIEGYSDYLLEMGALQMEYSVADIESKYEGHYMILWKRDENGRLRVVSEIFGANKYLDPKDVPYANVKLMGSESMPKIDTSNLIYAEVLEFDAVLLKAVADGDGDARARGFTNDAILMSNFDSIRVGMKAIRPKMLSTYNKNVSFNVKHTYFQMYALGEYVFVTSHYKGGWGDESSGGRFEGNMANLLKRTDKGNLLMHRQAGNRDSELVIVD